MTTSNPTGRPSAVSGAEQAPGVTKQPVTTGKSSKGAIIAVAIVIVVAIGGHRASHDSQSRSGSGAGSTTSTTDYGSYPDSSGTVDDATNDGATNNTPAQPPDPALNNDWNANNYVNGGGLYSPNP